MDKLKMHTPNLADENYQKLAELFPNAVTETINENGEIIRAIDADVLRQEISSEVVEGNQERYQFNWPDKRKSIMLANQPIAKTLRLDRDKSVGRDGTPGEIDSENIYIEGDNLDALKLLQETYLGKVKMIYIDPPYNTGNDFIYHDNFSMNTDEFVEVSGQIDNDNNKLVQNKVSEGRFHTNWLNMIYPRLRLAKDLLSEDGFIFISIDDNEIENTKKICNEIFGSQNFIGQITVIGNPGGRDYGGIARTHEYVLVYAKSPKAKINLIKDKEKSFTMFDEIGGFSLRELRNRNIKFNKENRPNLYYPFFINPKEEDQYGLHPISLEPKEDWIELWPQPSQGIDVVWRWGKKRSLANLNTNILAKPKRNGGFMIVEKYRESKIMSKSVWSDKNIRTERGTLTIKDLMEAKVFDYPKSVELIQRIIEMGSSETSIILDFFSGSATTAHALLKQNAEDKGYRQFILIQFPEITDEKSEAKKAGYNTICDIGEERIKRAGAKIREKTGADIDYGFRVFKVDSSNIKDVYYNPSKISQEQIGLFTDNIKDDRTPEDLLIQVMLDLGIPLSSKIEEVKVDGKNVFSLDDGFLIACFDENITDETVTQIAKMEPFYAVFRDSSMKDDSVMVNYDQIFEIYSPKTQRKVL